jgi:hypothetical protein
MNSPGSFVRTSGDFERLKALDINLEAGLDAG